MGARHDHSEEWYWDLERRVAVPASERGPGDQMLGPYGTKGEAENWKATVEARNDAWDDADEEWAGEEWAGEEWAGEQSDDTDAGD